MRRGGSVGPTGTRQGQGVQAWLDMIYVYIDIIQWLFELYNRGSSDYTVRCQNYLMILKRGRGSRSVVRVGKTVAVTSINKGVVFASWLHIDCRLNSRNRWHAVCSEYCCTTITVYTHITMSPSAFLCLLGALGAHQAWGCFDPSIGCKGPSPRIPPDQLYHFVRRNQLTILKTHAADYVRFTDKVLFKNYCKQKNVATLENIAVFDQADWASINFDALPASFVMKSNKGSGRNIIVRDGVLLGDNGGPLADRLGFVWTTIRHWGDTYLSNVGTVTEPWYEFIKPKILIEQLQFPVPDDIRVFVYNHTFVDLIQITSSGARHNFYDAELNRLPYHRIGRDNFEGPSVVEVIKTPKKIAEMHRIALTLAADVGVDLVRIDLYHINDTFYGSEVTLAPVDGAYNIVPGKFTPIILEKKEKKKERRSRWKFSLFG